jgi:hypothetical protein
MLFQAQGANNQEKLRGQVLGALEMFVEMRMHA